jgi:regulation of enolase protein 1 (concanavalin A-like superfamily)
MSSGILLLNLSSQKSSAGIFKSSSDIGNPKLSGSVVYNSGTSEYEIAGAGYNIWFDRDEFQYLWKKIKGDFILKARIEFVGQGVEAHRKIGWMARNDLTAGSSHASAVVHGDGLTSLQYRDTVGGQTKEVRSDDHAPDFIQFERKGNSFFMSTASGNEPLKTVQLEKIILKNKVYIGLFVCSHNPDVMEKATFRDVTINTDGKHLK